MMTHQAKQISKSWMLVGGSVLQRKCVSCGDHMVASGGECPECSKKKKWKGLQSKLRIGEPGDVYEREADKVADQMMAMQTPVTPNKTPISIRRFSGYRAGQELDVPPSVERVLGNPGRSLPPSLLEEMEVSFGHDFSGVRVRSDTAAQQSALDVNANAYTLGQNIVFGKGKFAPETKEGKHLLAHELTHVVQQSGNRVYRNQNKKWPCLSPISPMVTRTIARSIDDPHRYDMVHQNLFVDAPITSSHMQQPWGAATGAQIIQQFKNVLQQDIDRRPMNVMGDVQPRTTEAAAEGDALVAQQRLTSHYPQIDGELSPTQIRSVVTVLAPDQRPSLNYVKQWIENKLSSSIIIGSFNVTQSDQNLQNVANLLANDSSQFDFTGALATLRTQLLQEGWSEADVESTVDQQRQRVADLTWADVLAILASRVGAFAVQGQQITLSPGITTTRRRLTLLHELIHFFAHDDYKAWVAATSGERFYNEGFTELLARQVMTPQEMNGRDEYQDRVNAITQEVATYVPVNDIANAYFKGEVWRIETQSTVARRLFGTQVGVYPNTSHIQERTQSLTARGIVQTVTLGQHYRFMNLGINEGSPKPEHEAALHQIITDHVLNNPNARLRFVGHASTSGSAYHNRVLGRNRARAFYALARQLGVAQNQLLMVDDPPTKGESMLNVSENDQVIHRALNRRVELFIE